MVIDNHQHDHCSNNYDYGPFKFVCKFSLFFTFLDGESF